jgi:hypothetical protein
MLRVPRNAICALSGIVDYDDDAILTHRWRSILLVQKITPLLREYALK